MNISSMILSKILKYCIFDLYHITDKGDLYTWGVNGTGHLGLGSLGDQYFPLRVRIKTFLQTKHKLYATLRMDVMSLRIFRKAGLKRACCC